MQCFKIFWSEVKCADVRWSEAVGGLNGVMPNKRVVKCSWVKFKWQEVKCSEAEWSVVKWSDGLSNSVSNIIRIYANHMMFSCLYGFFVYHILSYSFGSILYHCIYVRMFCMLLFNSVNYVISIFVYLICIVMFMYSCCYVCSVLCILFFYVLFVCICVLYCTVLYCTVLLPPGFNPIAVNKYINVFRVSILCIAPPWRWPYEWSKHVEGIHCV